MVRWYSLVTDIDERKRAEDELEKAFEEIKRLKTASKTRTWRLGSRSIRRSCLRRLLAPHRR